MVACDLFSPHPDIHTQKDSVELLNLLQWEIINLPSRKLLLFNGRNSNIFCRGSTHLAQATNICSEWNTINSFYICADFLVIEVIFQNGRVVILEGLLQVAMVRLSGCS